MNNEDLKQIRQVFKEEFKAGFEGQFGSVWEHNLEPTLNGLHGKVDNLVKKINTLPDKTYIDNKLADLEGTLIVKLRKEDEKMNRLIELLRERNVLGDSEVAMLMQFEVFPRLPQANS